jgi:Fungal specific transcription factor domain
MYHHFVTTTAVRFFRRDHISFWRDEVAQLSCGFDLVYEALLAVGALHRASLLNCQHKDGQEAARSRVLGLHSYGNALRLLPNHLTQPELRESIAVQAVLILLTFCEVCPKTLALLSARSMVY